MKLKAYCRSCEKVTEHRQKLKSMVCNKCDVCNHPVFLKRIGDGRSNVGSKVLWIEWNEDGRGKAIHQDPQVGFSLCLDPYTISSGLPGVNESVSGFGWMTTPITEIIEDRKTKSYRMVSFKTKNSEYVLYQTLKDE